MSVLIPGMEMPKSCFYCPFREKINPDDYVCLALNREFEETFSLIAGKRHKDCPLVPVPDHGRLIDADKLCGKDCYGCPYDSCAIAEMVQDAPTIIPADKEEQ